MASDEWEAPRFRGFCLHCNSRLIPRGQNSACLTCGRPFDPADPSTYFLSSPWRRPSVWLPGVLIAIFVAVSGYALADRFEERGVALFLALPAAVGFVLGFMLPGSMALMAVLVPAVLLAIGVVLATFDLGGLFCLMILYAMALPITSMGLLLGHAIRRDHQRSTWRRLAALLLAIAIPLVGGEVIHALGPRGEIVLVRTSRTLPVAPEVAWEALHFYEEIQDEPPWILRLGLPIPLRAEGSKAAVGDIEVCIYEEGKGITKRMTRREEARILEFEVIEQNLHFERDLTLLGGAFELEPVSGGATRLTLSTRYRARSYPAWLWRSLEAHVLHTLHGHVAEAIERKAVASEWPQEARRSR